MFKFWKAPEVETSTIDDALQTSVNYWRDKAYQLRLKWIEAKCSLESTQAALTHSNQQFKGVMGPYLEEQEKHTDLQHRYELLDKLLKQLSIQVTF